MAAPALAQTAPQSTGETDQASNPANANDIIVTAQRVEQRLQDVPISITVFDETKLTNNNIQSARDIATYTPGLSTNNRYGADNTTWTIRGFTQEQRTTATVGTFFADVVMPRASGATQGGEGAGPGYLFDLQNVQVLKGPQGTLFGRNSTGGAVLIVPKKPTDRLEGYVEGQLGDYNLRRVQAVLNVPINDTFKVRFGLDRNKRDGYLKNAGTIGFGPNGNAGGSVDYWAARVSVVADFTPDIENYTVANWSKSKSTGLIPKITRCFTAAPPGYAAFSASTVATGQQACDQMAREATLGFWSVSNPLPDEQSDLETWQVINNTTWRASDNLTVKNILSYGELRGITDLDLFGAYKIVPNLGSAVVPVRGTETSPNNVQPFNVTHSIPNGYSNRESSFVEELQFQGRSDGGRWIWQGGFYLENSDPLGVSGIQSTTQTPCIDLATFNCVPGQNGSSLGRLAYQDTLTKFRDKAIYFQTSYDVTDKLKLTGGIRYTWDEVDSIYRITAERIYSAPVASVLNGTPITFPAGTYFYCLNDVTFGRPGSATNQYRPLDQRFGACTEHHNVKSHAPTWLLDVDFKPMQDVLLYAKWSRGYRQGAVASFAADTLQDYGPEKVDTYEVGAKTSWRGMMPGYFNVSAFYNDFRNQQLQIGLSCLPVSLCAQTTAIINAAKSRLWGVEVEAGITPFEGLRLEASYAYLNTKILSIVDLQGLVTARGLPFTDIRPLPVGSVIPNSIPHKLVLSGNYTFPLPPSVGKVTVGATWVYTSRYRAVSDPFVGVQQGSNFVAVQPYSFASEFGVLPSSKLLNLNATWDNVGGMPVDLGVFVTNVTNAHVYLHSNVQAASGFVSNIIGEPRMWGARLRYKFGR
ncbi:MAG: TonB-dependent receptor [Novosphingobium sp.]|nr:TonB-dependent receptor [Novosphingobium sp.]